MVAPAGAGDDVVGLERFAGMQSQEVAFDAIDVVADDFQVAVAEGGPEVGDGDDAEAGVAPECTGSVSTCSDMGRRRRTFSLLLQA